MKLRIGIVSYCIALLSLAACKKTGNETALRSESDIPQEITSRSSSTSKMLPGCPEGTHAVLAYDFDEFRFHRPKYDCERGFWFCTVNGSGWYIDCVPNKPVAYIRNGTAFVWVEELDNNQVEFHFPLDLKNDPNYSREDLATFNVDDEYILYEGITLIPGDYAVKETATELVVVVDYK